MPELDLAVRDLLDAYPWAGSTGRLRLLGFDVELRAEDGRVTDLLGELYGPLRRPGAAEHVLSMRSFASGSSTGWDVHLDGIRVLRTRAASIAFRHLLWEANQEAIRRTSDLVLVHAAAVADGGRAVVLPGPMGAGKSTLAAALVERGLSYLTDEVAAIDPASGAVQPYAKYLSLGPALARLVPPRAADLRKLVGDQHLVAPTSIRADAVATAAPPVAVVLPRFERGSATRLAPILAPVALPAVVEQTFHLGRDGDRTLSTVASMVDSSACFTLVSGDVDAACDAVLGVLG